jgi:hypothetical protein
MVTRLDFLYQGEREEALHQPMAFNAPGIE